MFADLREYPPRRVGTLMGTQGTPIGRCGYLTAVHFETRLPPALEERIPDGVGKLWEVATNTVRAN